MSVILHITKRDRWAEARKVGGYEDDSLGTQDFIHCSRPDQVNSVANSKFRGQEDLLLLCIDTDKVVSEIRYENCEGGKELFPHIYGALNLDAVIGVYEFPTCPEGSFVLPEKLSDNIS